jgi:hypothetical protein
MGFSTGSLATRKERIVVASKDQYIQALLALRDKGRFRNTKFLAMLRAQYAAENHTITATKLAEAVEYENFNAANLQYGTLGHEIAVQIGYDPPKRENGEPIWFWSISSGNDASSETIDGHYEFVMRPELVEALKQMKWVK